MSDKPKRGIFKTPAPKKPERQPLNDLEKTQRALSLASRPVTLAECLTPDQQAEIAATVTDDGFATEATEQVVRTAVMAYYDTQKAVVDEDPAPAELPATESPAE